jgi:hypothetical protein
MLTVANSFSNRKDLLKGPRHLAGEAYCDMAKVYICIMFALDWCAKTDLTVARCSYALVAFRRGSPSSRFDCLVRIWERA